MWYKVMVLFSLPLAIGRAAAEETDKTPPVPAEASAASGTQAAAPRLPAPKGATAMPKPDRVWIDKQRGQVAVFAPLGAHHVDGLSTPPSGL